MTDTVDINIAREFEADCSQRKRVGRNSYNKKRGSKSRKCSLSTDYMTQKQWKERNGEIVAVDLNAPITWRNFKKLSEESQCEYLTNLVDRYAAPRKAIAAMMGVSSVTLAKYIEQRQLGSTIFSHRGKVSHENALLWRRFLNGEFSAEAVRKQANEATEDGTTASVGNELIAPHATEELNPAHEPFYEKPKSKMTELSLTFNGVIDVKMITHSLLTILGKDSVGSVKIICQLEE